ncbi:PREDICTED: uncharacterized protein LOC104589381 isoform X2 [Nelumbo nucifera]|uniref:Uncharacterized protein LOC104589381 isoform X2 n=1 Tax=Nelumbo nucifera TaxID=4432 RepID=A0A1U7Z1Q3_NELNU|nr:PREDICTED: uncharacterized protein LOC104589381 isoform X2 [Nelumbo nucifera]
MDLGSWFRRSLWRKKNKSQISVSSPTHRENARKHGEQEEEQFGVTEQFRDFVKSFTLDTFKNFHIPDDQGTTTGDDCPTTSANVRKDLSEWQEQHATLVLSKVKEISQLRYVLCPRHLKETEFWRIYFILVKNYVAPCDRECQSCAALCNVYFLFIVTCFFDDCYLCRGDFPHDSPLK